MRPIWMRIKGLNSFLEAQDIDFEQLTSQGLFGIFGPTGSGKSSILDGITMALYGTTSRNSTNYINVNTDRASVDYIFSVKEKKEHIYRVSRSFKRTKEGSIRSDGAKFIEFKGEEQEILADKVGAVNEKCREVIGLSKEDFFRTVVLPQGKFSEFLKLEGMERNKMLERLFHLEQYGEHLVSLIKEKEGQWEGQKKEKEGALSRYEDVSKERIEELKKMEQDFGVLLKKKEQEITGYRNRLENARKIVQYQTEYEMLAEEAAKLEAMREEIQQIQVDLKNAEKANILLEYLQDADQAEMLVKNHSQSQKELYEKWLKKQGEAEGLKTRKLQMDQKLQMEKPELELQKAKLEDAVGLSEEKKRQKRELEKCRKETADLHQELEDACGKMDGLIKDIDKWKDRKEILVQEIKDVTILAEVQRTVEEGFRFSKEIQQDKKREAELEKRLEQWMAERIQIQKEQEQILKQEETCKEQEKALEEAIIKQQEQKKSVEKSSEAFYVKNLAAILAADLKEGEPCPVCGSLHHTMEYQVQDGGKTHQRYLKEDLELLQKEYQNQIKQREILEKELEEKEKTRRNLREKIHDFQTKRARKEAEKENLAVRLGEGETERNTIHDENERRIKHCSELGRRCQVTDFVSAYAQILEKNKIREEKQGLLNQIESGLEARIKNKEKGEAIIQSKRTKSAELEVMLRQISENIKELDRQILEKAGTDENLEEQRQKTVQKIRLIEQEYRQTADLWEQIQKEEVSLRQTYAAQEALTESAKENLAKKVLLLKEKMLEFQVEEEAWIKNFKREKSDMQAAQEKIDVYKESVVRIKTQLDHVEKQLDGKSVAAEELENLEQNVRDLESEITEQNKALGAIKKELEQSEKSWKEKEELQKVLEVIYHKLDILTELDGLFRGKKFVEYVSRYYLEYVSREADERLKEMTGSSYGLETDGNGMFVIRDYKNGGVSRPASTLSGGETFLASLALALALSSQIQMKGAAPLELFFLDEGFGTLDKTYLEVVMESLEKIRNKRRSVGVITHVEEIKSRIPVRLIVEPAKMGEGGSRIQIEHA